MRTPSIEVSILYGHSHAEVDPGRTTATMMNVTGLSDPRDHPDNANLPTVNSAASIIAVTILMLVCNAKGTTQRGWTQTDEVNVVVSHHLHIPAIVGAH
jgi:hypothetical protein